MTQLRALFNTVAALAVVFSLGACASKVPGRIDKAETPTEHFPLTAKEQPHEIALAVHANGVSQNQANALSGFVEDWQAAGRGVITIQAPVGGADPGMAGRMGDLVTDALIAIGVDQSAIQLLGYDAQGSAVAPIRVRFQALEAVVAPCGQKWGSLSSSATNQVQQNFGCAVTANMAAQIANPADILAPQGLTPVDAARRQMVVDKYRKGELTSSAKDDQAQGVVSNAVK